MGGGEGAWVDMGVRVGGLFGPKTVPLAPLPVLKVEKILLPPGCMPVEVGLGSPV